MTAGIEAAFACAAPHWVPALGETGAIGWIMPGAYVAVAALALRRSRALKRGSTDRGR
jgi:hypothetical protein